MDDESKQKTESPEPVTIPARDPERLAEFYCRVFDATPHRSPGSPFAGPMLLTMPGAAAAIVVEPADRGRAGALQVTLHCPTAFRRAHRQLVCLAATTTPLRQDADEVLFDDPEGKGLLLLAPRTSW
jgi:hypothetical protein